MAGTFYPLVDCCKLVDLIFQCLTNFTGQYGISIVENLGIMGIPLPNWITDNLEKLRNRSDKN
ncbi:phage holin family protein [Companilactobacillus bobalius]|uniref:phage holin family protein n=1 Tax=Companilactobacillus bobalius TaxID=2801451 RepID=UPI0013027E92|nr:hypothetical protein ATN92_10870 [Companilactobacillus bobalius]